MTGTTRHDERPAPRRGLLLWGAAGVLMLLPVVAMRFTDSIAWDGADFALLAVMLAAGLGAWTIIARTRYGTIYRAAAALALATAFLLVWANLSVGVIGDERNPANLMHGGVLAVGVAGAVVAWLRPTGMARAMLATATTQALVAMIAVAAGSGLAVLPTLLFVALWLASAALFRSAARTHAAARVPSVR